MTIANDVASILTEREIAAMRALEKRSMDMTAPVAKRLKALGIYDPKSPKRPLTLYGGQVARILKETGRWQS